MKSKSKYTTNALNENQYLVVVDYSITEVCCVGFTDNKIDHSLNGWYYKKELTRACETSVKKHKK